ncbi:iron dicitrate transport regulator FecR [Fibrisoma montanum]|uniref:Iron dicitrate transport regulator FecR n=1 Tax=Fibrisoma montanum TaxID=2305895 RepID=A0A418MHX3_9BACT|nr:FecR family protein [Fibrisoma montanum]RIV26963.1 iron dicitrate transport regulator FecR [Fibrisoma montanum]
MKPYASYSAEEFALDDLFVRWVQHPDDEEVVAFWQVWLAQHPECADTVDIARELILTGSQPTLPSLTSDEVSSVWGRIRESLQTMEDVRPLQPDVRSFVGWWYFFRTVAAAIGVVVFIGWALWMQYGNGSAIQTVRTTDGQARTLKLPDGTTVRLHANSQIRYARQWSDETPHAVWLQGEADFSVIHRNDTSSAHLFRVHTNDLTAESLGTDFRVTQNTDGTHVKLSQGRLRLLLGDQVHPVPLHPGQAIWVSRTDDKPTFSSLK